MKAFIHLVFALILFFNASCAFKLRKRNGKEPFVSGSSTLNIHTHASRTLKVLYTGCGGLLVAKGDEEAFLTDPYYTAHHPLRVFSGIKPDPANATFVFEKIQKVIDTNKIKAVLVSHSHYDHLEDLPLLLSRNKFADKVKIIGSPTASCTLKNFIGNNTFVNADDSMYRQAPNLSGSGTWVAVSKYIRVLPIEAQHAPHFYFGIHAMRCKKCGQDHKTNCCRNFKHLGKDKRTWAFKWKEGTTYSFLVDILDDAGEIELRLFLQTSSCNPPYAFPPIAELTKKSVDVAFLCVASSDYLDNYPEAILSLLKPTQTVLIHWEDFFRDLYEKNPKRVRGTSTHRFVKHLRKHYNVKKTIDLKSRFIMPEPLTLIDISY